MTKLLIATRNPAKFKRLHELLSDFKLELLSLNDLNIKESAPEVGKKFEQIAESKVRFYSELSKLPTMSDDSGLEIDALNGWPGPQTRRIFGPDKPEATDDELVTETLRRMGGIPYEKRTCRFTAVEALIIPGEKLVHLARFSTEGYLLTEPYHYRRAGFPLESLFYIPQAGKTAAELDELGQLPNFFVHRKQAIIELEPYLKKLENLC
jgi:XTP/dITP diphosphohydrolase